MSYRQALDTLANKVIAGVPHRYGLDTLPAHLQRGQLPCTLVVPLQTQGLSQQRGEGFMGAAFAGGGSHVQMTATHLLLVAPASAAIPMCVHLPLLTDLVDATLTVLAADPLLSNTLAEPAQVRVELGVFEWGGTSFYGVAFRHGWVMRV